MIQSIKLLLPDDAVAAWDQLGPLFASVSESNEIAQDEFSVEELYDDIKAGLCGVFAYYEDGILKLALAIQFSETGKDKTAEIVAMAGEGLMRFKAAYWGHIVQWLKANGVKRLDAYGNSQAAAIYQKKFGFDKSCQYVRMAL